LRRRWVAVDHISLPAEADRASSLADTDWS
jgi:hypothetical protein